MALTVGQKYVSFACVGGIFVHNILA